MRYSKGGSGVQTDCTSCSYWGSLIVFSGSGSFSLFEGLDSRLRVCTRSRMPKIAIEITGWRKNSGRDYGIIEPYCSLFQAFRQQSAAVRGSELSCTLGKQAGGGRKGGESSLPLSPFSLPSFLFLFVNFSPTLQSERLEQANPIVDPLSGPSILRKRSSPADNVGANTRKGCKR